MDERTINAVKGSIRKWESIVSGTGTDTGVDNCPLCSEFRLDPHKSGLCVECPVADASGRIGCSGTPYSKWSSHQSLIHSRFNELSVFHDCPDCKQLAQAELDFIKSLLPAEEAVKPPQPIPDHQLKEQTQFVDFNYVLSHDGIYKTKDEVVGCRLVTTSYEDCETGLIRTTLYVESGGKSFVPVAKCWDGEQFVITTEKIKVQFSEE